MFNSRLEISHYCKLKLTDFINKKPKIDWHGQKALDRFFSSFSLFKQAPTLETPIHKYPLSTVNINISLKPCTTCYMAISTQACDLMKVKSCLHANLFRHH